MTRWFARRPWLLAVVAGVVVLFLVAACSGGNDGGGDEPTATDQPSVTQIISQAPCKGGPGVLRSTGGTGVTAAGLLEGDNLVIGVLVPSTGESAMFGQDFINAANLAAKCLNNAGGVNGGAVVILTGDTMALPVVAIAEAGRLLDGEGAVAIMGGASSSVSVAVAEAVTIGRGVLQISPVRIEPGSTPSDGRDFFHSMQVALDGEAGESFDEAFASEYGAIYTSPSVREAFDAIIVIGLAAQAAGTNTDSLAIRDSLRDVANPPGSEYGADEADISAALADVSAGEDIDYDGASDSVEFE